MGTTVLQRFEVIESIGSGGMGSVYKARDLTLKREVVLKVIAQSSLDPGKLLMRFQNEAKALSRLKHSNIATIFDFGVMEDGAPYLAIEFVDGVSLSQFIEPDSLLSPAEVIDIFIQICDALQHAHDEGIIHRDIKPSNIMLIDQSDTLIPILLDFGIAKIENENCRQTLTEVGNIIGSPLYMSPEQASSKPVLTQSDQYSLGCVLFESLTGCPPFEGESVLEIVSQHAAEMAPSLKDKKDEEWPDELEALVAKLLAKEPAERFDDMRDCRNALSSVLEKVLDMGASSQPEVEAVPQRVWYQQKKWIIPIAGIVLFAIASISLSVLFQEKPETGKLLLDDRGITNFENTSRKALLRDIENGVTTFSLRYHFADIDLEPFSKYKQARWINVSNNGAEITDDGIKYLVDCPLSFLALNHTAVRSLENVSKIRTLQSLELIGTEIDDRSLSKLKNLPMLRSLNINSTRITDRGLQVLTEVPTLQFIYLLETPITEAGRKQLAKKMPNLSFRSLEPAIVSDLNSRATQFMERRQHEKAIPLLEKCISTIEKAQGKDSPSLCTFLHHLAQCYLPKHSMDKILPLVKREFYNATKHGDRLALLDAYNLRAHVYFMEGQIPESLKMREEGLKLIELLEGKRSLGYANKLADTAIFYSILGNYKEANKRFERALQIYKQQHKTSEPHYAFLLVNYGNELLRQNKAEAGFTRLKEAEELLAGHRPKAGEGNGMVDLYGALSTCEQSNGNLERAIEKRLKAVDLARQFGIDEKFKIHAESLVDLYKKNGNTEEAKLLKDELNQRALKEKRHER